MTRMVLAVALFAITADAVWGQKRQLRELREFELPAQPVPPKPALQVPADTNPDPKSLEYGDAELSKARALARRLGSKDYKERDAASRELGKIGRAAVIALKEVRATDPNPEVRLRTDILLPRAESEDLRARVFCFLADKDGKFDHKLPGWTKFRAVAGSDKTARELFTEVLRRSEYHTLLMAADMTAADLAGVLTAHYQALQHKQNFGNYVQPTAAELAVLTFLECQYPEKDVRLQGQMGLSVGNYLYQQDIQNAMRNGGGKYGAALQRIVGRWMDTRDSAFGLQAAMNLAQNSQMKDHLKYAARLLASDDKTQPWAKANAAQQIVRKHATKDGKAEARKYAPMMLKGLDDGALLTQVFVNNNPNQMIGVNTQDYILAVLCQLTDQKPADYGLDTNPAGGNNIQNIAAYYFNTADKKKGADKREAGIKKFKAWAVKNLKDEPKKDEPKKDEPKKDDGPFEPELKKK